ncbi:PaaI family thioesterase [Intrasporangium sp.]|uniref:PaaI family thioesterase n=1 Tax=Intrasporangium sp. TaxID=1925024 RepID=UPI002939BEF0|nr:PaaI family thioesterase [Intrasporangium sp.]MDV3222271.1 PaaI family thioesterase [Intrasporangium sp.]
MSEQVPESVDTVETVEAVEAWQEEPRGGAANFALLAWPGVEVLRTLAPGGLTPAAPVARLTGRRLVSADPGEAVYALPKSDWYLSSRGAMHPAMLAFLADAALTGAVQASLPARTLCTTAELSMTFCSAVPRGGDHIVASGRAIHVDDAMGLAEVFITDNGHLVAHGTSRSVVLRPIPEGRDLGEIPDAPPLEAPPATPDPWQRPLPGGVPSGEDLQGRAGLDVLRDVLDGTRPRPPVDRLLGLRLTSAEAGRVTFEQRAHGWLTTEQGKVYGGATAFLAMSAASATVQTVADPSVAPSALDLKVNFLRPVDPDGETMTASGTILHEGRELVIATSEVTHHGRTVALATGTTALRRRRTG